MKHRTLHTIVVAMLASAAFGASANHSGGDDKFKSMDTDGDGQISSAEHAAGVTRMFGEMDANKDGFVTADEMDAMHGKSGMHDMDMKSSDKIGRMDKDGDGKMSSAEHDSGAAEMFTKMDANKDGMLSQSEMSSAHGKMMKDKDKAAGKMDHAGHDAASGTNKP